MTREAIASKLQPAGIGAGGSLQKGLGDLRSSPGLRIWAFTVACMQRMQRMQLMHFLRCFLRVLSSF